MALSNLRTSKLPMRNGTTAKTGERWEQTQTKNFEIVQ